MLLRLVETFFCQRNLQVPDILVAPFPCKLEGPENNVVHRSLLATLATVVADLVNCLFTKQSFTQFI